MVLDRVLALPATDDAIRDACDRTIVLRIGLFRSTSLFLPAGLAPPSDS
jgi:hypothetical protein